MSAIVQPIQPVSIETGLAAKFLKTCCAVLGVLVIFVLGSVENALAAAETGQQIYQSRCSACHTIGGGKTIGPDLAGVSSRREESWLIRQIKEPDRLLAEKDPIAIQLLQEANGIPMVPLGLTDADVSAVIEYLKSTEIVVQQILEAANAETDPTKRQQLLEEADKANATVATGLPSEYFPTVLISIVILIGLTLIGLKAGKKEVDVR